MSVRTSVKLIRLIRKSGMLWMLCLLIAVPSFRAHAQASNKTAKDQRMEWWREARFGMFIHWGVYAQLAGVYEGHEQRRGGAEWIMNRMKIPVKSYQSFAKVFNPVKFDADKWVMMAKEAGMKYIIITAKHHDGFAMFKSAASPWNIVDATPYGKDVLKQLSEACARHGMRLGFYYSQAQDWNNPGGAASRKLTSEGWDNPDSARIDAYTKAHNGHWDPSQTTASFDNYINRVAVPQVKELLSHYGKISVLWWDTPTNMTDAAAQKLQDVLKLQPGIITNDRLKRPNFPGDTKTPEQKIPNVADLDGKDWETCMTMNGTWGYRRSDHKWKSTATLIHNLCDIASKGGNYLLNVGPKPDGTFPQASVERLEQIGAWMKVNGEAIYATQASPLPPLDWGRCTRKNVKDKNKKDQTILYLSVFNWPTNGTLTVPAVKTKVLSATLLSNGAVLKTQQSGSSLAISVGPKAPDNTASIIKVVVSGNMPPWLPPGASSSKMQSGALD